MGAIKENNYTFEETELCIIGRAIAHPARVKMITELLYDNAFSSTDLTKQLRLSGPSVKAHIEMLKDAEFIQVEYFVHFYLISLTEKGRKWSEIFRTRTQENVSF